MPNSLIRMLRLSVLYLAKQLAHHAVRVSTGRIQAVIAKHQFLPVHEGMQIARLLLGWN